jgi:UDP-N-acetylglucosamine 1-carboxyvinyltransferase
VQYRQKNKDAVACLHQARTIDYRRLYSKLGELDKTDFALIKIGFINLYDSKVYSARKKFSPPSLAGSRESPEGEQNKLLLAHKYNSEISPVKTSTVAAGILSNMPTEERNFVVEGGSTLSGSIVTNRSKNGAVALLAASLLNRGVTTLQKVPKIEEVNRLIEVLRSIGVTAEWSDRDLILTPPEKIDLDSIDKAAATRTRSILMFIGPLLHHFNSFSIPQSGGCNFGTRTVRPHLWALEKFGVTIESLTDRYAVSHTKLSPATIVMQESSDTATENALFAAARIPGTTVIKYASANYQVQEVCGFLQSLGVQIEGIGSTTLTITGVSEIHRDVKYTVAEDPTDAMFFLAAAIVTKSSLTIKNAPIEFLEIELSVLEKMNLNYSVTDAGISENGITKLADIHVEPSSLVAYPERIHARPYPGLNIDNLPFFAVIATQAEGTTLIHDWTFEKRAIYYTELDRLGAETVLMDPHRIQIIGPSHLRGAEIVCPPALRPATILLIGMLAAEGRSILRNVYSINRGYEDLVHRLESIGAHVEGMN